MAGNQAFIFTVLSMGLSGVFGHGAMYFPNPWHTTKGCGVNGGCTFEMKVPSNCTRGPDGTNNCNRGATLNAWFTNFTMVEEETLPSDMYSSGNTKTSAGINPWSSPGAAKVYGDGCGVNGGNPKGCKGEDYVFGRCCGFGSDCGGYVGGKPALKHYQDGFFGKPKTTTWFAGQPAEVAWASGAHHRGGYAYRLCRVTGGKIWTVTEECFQKGHLNFYGTKTWVINKPGSKGIEGMVHSEEDWQEEDLITTTEGTTPPGSQWASLLVLGEHQRGDMWVIKDLVDVPKTLRPGNYVLSFRWDAQRTPQVWSSCANIRVVRKK